MRPYANPSSSHAMHLWPCAHSLTYVNYSQKTISTTAITANILGIVLYSSSNFVTFFSIQPDLSCHSFVHFELNIAENQSVVQGKCLRDYRGDDFVPTNNELSIFSDQFLVGFPESFV